MKLVIHSQHWSLGLDTQFHPTLYSTCHYLSMLGLKFVNALHRFKGWEGSCIIISLMAVLMAFFVVTSILFHQHSKTAIRAGISNITRFFLCCMHLLIHAHTPTLIYVTAVQEGHRRMIRLQFQLDAMVLLIVVSKICPHKSLDH